MNILSTYLEKLGINDISKADPEEKITFEKWKRILSEGEMNLDKIVLFCRNQCDMIEHQWQNLDNSDKKNERLILLHTVYSKIVTAITAPQVEKENLEKYLNHLLDEKRAQDV